MYDERGVGLPKTPGGAPKYLVQHDFVTCSPTTAQTS